MALFRFQLRVYIDELIVETAIKPGSMASLLFQQAVTTFDGTPLCRAEVKVAAVAADTLKPIRIPRQLASALAPYLNESTIRNEVRATHGG